MRSGGAGFDDRDAAGGFWDREAVCPKARKVERDRRPDAVFDLALRGTGRDATRQVGNVGGVVVFGPFDDDGEPLVHGRPRFRRAACFKIEFSVPGGRVSVRWPATCVTVEVCGTSTERGPARAKWVTSTCRSFWLIIEVMSVRLRVA